MIPIYLRQHLRPKGREIRAPGLQRADNTGAERVIGVGCAGHLGEGLPAQQPGIETGAAAGTEAQVGEQGIPQEKHIGRVRRVANPFAELCQPGEKGIVVRCFGGICGSEGIQRSGEFGLRRVVAVYRVRSGRQGKGLNAVLAQVLPQTGDGLHGGLQLFVQLQIASSARSSSIFSSCRAR